MISNKRTIVAIIVLAVLLRVVFLVNASYGTSSEMFRDLIVVYNMFSSGELVLLGPSASLGGFYFGAMYYYILAPFVWLAQFQHYGAIMTSTVFSLASVVMIYKLLYLWFNQKDVAILGAGLLAISVFDIQNAYYVSNPNLLPFFLMIYWYGLTLLLQSKLSWSWVIAAGLAAGVATQLHSTALFILPLATALAVYIKKPEWNYKKTLTALVLAISTYIPFFVYESSNSYTNTFRIFELGTGNFSFVPNIQSMYGSVNHILNLFVIRNDIFDFVYLHPIVFAVLSIAILAFIWMMVRFVVRHAWQNGASMNFSPEGSVVIKCWLFITAATFLFYTNTVHFFYYLVIWPLPIILLTWYLHNLKLSGHLKQFNASIIILVVVQLTQLPFFYNFINHPELSYNNFRGIYSQIDNDADGQSYRIINNTIYVNHVLYYLRVSEYDRFMATDRAEVVYVLSESAQNGSRFDLANYDHKGQLNFNSFEATKFVRIK